MRLTKFLFLLSFIQVLAQNTIQVKTLVKNFPANGAVTVDSEGNLFVNEYGTATSDISGSGNRIFKVDSNGEYTVFLNNVKGPVGGAFHKNGAFYFNNNSSYTDSKLMRYKDGNLEKIADIPGFAADLLIKESTGDIIITNYTKPSLYIVDSKGKLKEYISDERLKGCTGITRGADETIFVSNFSTGKIYKVNNDEVVEFASIPIEYPGYVIGYITYFENTLYASGYGASKIYSISMDGEVSVFAGSGKREDIDGDDKNSGFFVPNGIEIDKKKRRLYISQNGNGQHMGLRYIDL